MTNSECNGGKLMKKFIAIILFCLLSGCLSVGCNNIADSTQDEAKEQDITASETVEETTEEIDMSFMTTDSHKYFVNFNEEPTVPIDEYTFYDNSTEFIVTEQCANKENMISEDGYSIMGGDKDVETLVLPSEYNGQNIVSVYYAAYYESTIKKLSISDSIEYIGFYSFDASEQLEEIKFGENLKKTGYCAFADCTSLKEIEFNDNLKFIGGCSFDGCRNLTKVVFKDNLNLIGASSFSHCDSLETLEFKGKYDNLIIGSCAFAYNPNLKKVYLPEGTIEIDSEAFLNCENLEELHIPASVTKFGYKANEENEKEYGKQYVCIDNDILRGTDATIYAPKGSVAEQYAKATNREFVAE